MKKIVILGGGTGLSTVLNGIKHLPVEITAIITVSDDGRSTGKLREEFSMPAVGDIRKVLVNLSTLPTEIKDIFEYRFSTFSDLDGHPMGNLLLTAAFNKYGKLEQSIKYISELLDVKHKVLPLSEDNLILMGQSIDGEIIEGEHNLTLAKKEYEKIYYKNKPKVNPSVITSIIEADLVILSMGSLFTSLLPHLICDEVQQALYNTKAKIMYISNAMTQPGETDNYGVSDHINVIQKYIGNILDAVIVCNTKLDKNILEKYQTEEQKDPVIIDYENLNKMDIEIIEDNLLVIEDNMIRHDSMKLSSIIFSYIMRW